MTRPKTIVVNCQVDASYDIYIGRPSKWGNPFKMDSKATRDQIVAKYEAWLLTQPHLLAALPELKGKRLGCWCAPRLCHGDVLARLANREGL